MVLSRWDPYTQTTSLREAMNRLFEESVIRPSALDHTGAGAALDVCEEGEHFIVEVAVPGVKPEDIDVSILGNTLTVRGEWPARPEGRQYLHSERGEGRFERTLTLPSEIDRDLSEFTTMLIAALGVLGLGLVMATFFQVRFGLSPLRAMRQNLAQIRSSEAERLEGDQPVAVRQVDQTPPPVLQALLNYVLPYGFHAAP